MIVLLTTVIGSFPRVDGMDLRDNIILAVESQIRAGIDLISDGQTRTDMITYFAEHAKGFQLKGDKWYIVDRIEHDGESVAAEDLSWVREYLQEKYGEKAPMLKGIVTGPITMIMSGLLKTKEYKGYRDPELYKDMGEFVNTEVQLQLEAGVDAIQIDEPYYSVGAPMDLAKEAVRIARKNVEKPVYLHVCGNVTKVFDTLLDFPVDVLSHAFAGEPKNFTVVSEEKLVKAGKKLGVGCVRSDTPELEDVPSIVEILRKAIEFVGKENIVIHPDCGLRGLKDDKVASEKLARMVQAVKEVE
ncbi:MAG: uroporphyrinogen decarboxylase family protein [Candidatus Freyrarchaeum guaymaensis]|nr:uroporphyrinogen decarboxylase family protein [Candidatus Sigynarchaeota archaeon]